MKRLITSVQKRDVLSISLLLIFGTTLLVNMVDIHVAGQGTEIQVINPQTEQSDFKFYTGTSPVGTRFNATVWITGYTGVFAWQVSIKYDPAAGINCTGVWVADFRDDYIFVNKPGVRFPVTAIQVINTTTGQPIPGVAMAGDSLTLQTPASSPPDPDPASLAIFEFNITKAPEKGQTLTTVLNIDNEDTFLLDYDMSEISTTKTSGYYEYKYAVVNLEVKPNQYIADKLETFNVEVWLNNVTESDHIIGAQFRLQYNSTLLNTQNSSVTEGSFFSEFKNRATEPYTYFYGYVVSESKVDPTDYSLYGPHIVVLILLLPSEIQQYSNFPSGSGILATVTFRGIYRSFYGALNSPLTLTDVMLVDDAKNPPYGEPNVIPTGTLNGYYEVLPMQSPTADFTIAPDFPIVEQSVTFNASSSYDLDGTIVSYTWNFGDGNTTTVTSLVIIHRYVATGTYTVTLTVKDNDNLTNTKTSVVKVRDYPTAAFVYSPSVPAVGSSVTFDASSSVPNGGVILYYLWGFGDGSSLTNTTNTVTTHVFNAFGNYTITLTVKDNERLSDTTSQTIYVADLPTASFTYSPSEPYVGDTVTFNATQSYDLDGTIVSYVWDFGDGTNATVTSSVITHSYMATGTYNVTLTVIDDDGLSNSDAKPLTVIEAQPTGVPLDILIIAVLAAIVVVAVIVTYYKKIRKYKSRTV